MKAATKKNKRRISLIALILAGLAYMFFCILQMQKSVNSTESYSLLATRYGFGELIRNSISDSLSPVYLSALKVWLHFFGQTDIAARAFSMLLGAVALIEIYLIFKYRFSKKAAAWALALFATSPFFVWAGSEAGCIVYYLVLFFLFVYLALILKHSGRKLWLLPLVGVVAVSVLAIIIVLSNSQGVFFANIVLFACLCWIFHALASKKLLQNKIARLALVALVILNIVLLPNINPIRGLGGSEGHGRKLYGDIVGLGANEDGPVVCADIASYKELAPYVNAVYLEDARDAKVYENGKIEQIPEEQKRVWILAQDKEFSLDGWEMVAFSNLDYGDNTYYLELYQRD